MPDVDEETKRRAVANLKAQPTAIVVPVAAPSPPPMTDADRRALDQRIAASAAVPVDPRANAIAAEKAAIDRRLVQSSAVPYDPRAEAIAAEKARIDQGIAAQLAAQRAAPPQPLVTPEEQAAIQARINEQLARSAPGGMQGRK